MTDGTSGACSSTAGWRYKRRTPVNMFQFMSNFIDAKKGTTPAMREEVTDHIWTWGEFMSYSIQL